MINVLTDRHNRGERLTQFWGKTCFPMNLSCEHAYPYIHRKIAIVCFLCITVISIIHMPWLNIAAVYGATEKQDQQNPGLRLWPISGVENVEHARSVIFQVLDFPATVFCGPSLSGPANSVPPVHKYRFSVYFVHDHKNSALQGQIVTVTGKYHRDSQLLEQCVICMR